MHHPGALPRLLALATAAVALAVPSASAEVRPPYDVPADDLAAAVQCDGHVRTSQRIPVLLVHGTGVTAEENWGVGYRQSLLARGHAVCTVDVPDYAYGDVQTNVQYVAFAIRRVEHRAGRKISVVGHSQGAFLPLFALRVWPRLAAGIEDFVGIAGVYDSGSDAITAECASGVGCVPSFQQMASGSNLLEHLARRELPVGPSYSTIGTDADATVTPQPAANQQPGAHSVQIQDVCPGRHMPVPMDHVLMAGDAVMHALVLDALDHRGPARVRRVDPATCSRLFFRGVDVPGFLLEAPQIALRSGDPVTSEPPLRRWMRRATS
ncbi:alpha/beta fold hydrolase [Nocardioides humilatus]|uniref:Alpha/beta fold hydrolase n=1 Tax=Nocardioides humilatus TaxID=2607660 RepID=A0A5B1LDY3_9ACTN|nr:alpha/beta fold hydrolase [Nocardioides humilatus]KAA1418656.1 alpha/beta fold hydrolase [Nocardioides humilatus]